MKRFAVALLVLCVVVLVLSGAIAQRGGPPEGGRGRVAFVRGTVAAVDAGKRVVDIAPANDQDQVTSVTIADDALVAAIQDAKLTDLVVGDNVEISGFPAQLTAQSVRIGGGVDTVVRSAFLPPDATQGAFRPGAPPTTISGAIVSLNPLTIDIGEGVTIQVAAGENSEVTKTTLVELDALQPTEQILVVGRRGDQGAVTGQSLAVDRTEDGNALRQGMGGRGAMFGGRTGAGPGRDRGGEPGGGERRGERAEGDRGARGGEAGRREHD